MRVQYQAEKETPLEQLEAVVHKATQSRKVR